MALGKRRAEIRLESHAIVVAEMGPKQKPDGNGTQWHQPGAQQSHHTAH